VANSAGDRFTWAVGGFRDADNFGRGFDDNSRYNLTSRVTGLPWYEDEGRHLVHLGLSYLHGFRSNDMVTLAQRPGSRFIDPVVDIDVITDGVNTLNPEAALVYGPFSAQGEYTKVFLDIPDGHDGEYEGFYIELSYFLTGEHRPYKTKEARFDRIVPRRNFTFANGGWGAWQVAARYALLDVRPLADELETVDAAVSWHLNPNVRIMGGYIFAHQESIGDSHMAQARFQFDL
jgi:phosphate-selective porin OprO/OprP